MKFISLASGFLITEQGEWEFSKSLNSDRNRRLEVRSSQYSARQQLPEIALV